MPEQVGRQQKLHILCCLLHLDGEIKVLDLDPGLLHSKSTSGISVWLHFGEHRAMRRPSRRSPVGGALWEDLQEGALILYLHKEERKERRER